MPQVHAQRRLAAILAADVVGYTRLMEERTASERGVSWLVEGSVRKVGNRIRITAQLSEGATGGHVWAEQYDRELTDVLKMQDEITRTIVAQLEVKLLPDEMRAIAKAPTNVVDAYTAYLKGLDLFRLKTGTSLMCARQMFVRAIELDPDYAEAYAQLAQVLSELRSLYGENIAVADIIAETDRALCPNPDLAQAFVSRGRAYMTNGQKPDARQALDRALSLDPANLDAHNQFGRYFMQTGDFEASARHYRRAMEIQPEEYVAPVMVLQALQALGRGDEALAYARIGVRRAEDIQRQQPENSRPAQMLCASYAYLGATTKAMEWLDRTIAIDPDDNGVR